MRELLKDGDWVAYLHDELMDEILNRIGQVEYAGTEKVIIQIYSKYNGTKLIARKYSSVKKLTEGEALLWKLEE